MTEVSLRAEDAFDNAAKSAYRARHLEVLREHAPELWSDESRALNGAWLELMGATGWRTLELLLGAGALAAGSFVGVDLDVRRIADYRARYPEARWVAGDLLDLVLRPELEDVSVVHFDGYEAVASPRLEHVGEQLTLLLRRAVARFGAAALLWNADIDACRLHRIPAARSLRTHATTLATVLRAATGARRMVQPCALLPTDSERAVAAPSFVGQVGAFQIYRGKPGGHRMACLSAVVR
ncbi:MAG: hypothetical protein KIT58_05980 [Planctomycetota bacterium]|nr:hypothetical protein [Planctomycetota bacterium]